MIPIASLHLLAHDNSIPGNSKYGFRYHYPLLINVVTPTCVWFELWFGVRVQDSIGSGIVASDPDAIKY